MIKLRQKIDPANLYEIIRKVPEQFLNGYKKTKTTVDPKTKKVVFCGMGGSASPMNLFKTILNNDKYKFNIPIILNRNFELPQQVTKNWCGFFDSYSGNTEETISALKQAEERGLKQIVLLAHGGQLEKIAQNKDYTLIKIPDFNQPRMSYFYVVGALMKTFHSSGLLELDEKTIKADIKNSVKLIPKIQKQAEALACSMENKIPLIYSSDQWLSLARVWKINLNENAKTQSFWNVFPELTHNEINGFVNPLANYKIIILKDPDDHPRIKKQMQTFKKLLNKRVDCEIFGMQNGSAFFKMITALMLGLWTSYYLALLYKIDPAPVKIVEQFKKQMR